MEKLLLLAVIFTTCSAVPKDLSGKVMVFPRENNRDYVKLLTPQSKFNFVTVCLRFQTDLSRNYGLFSLSTSAHSDAFMLFKAGGAMRMHARDSSSDFFSLSLSPNTWHSVCATWRSDNGLAQLWVNGKPSIKRFVQTGSISGAPITMLGQDQDTYGGGFDASRSFIGMITKLHVWDYILPAAEIKRYMENKHFTPGNVFNWMNLNYEITGQIFVEEETEVM